MKVVLKDINPVRVLLEKYSLDNIKNVRHPYNGKRYNDSPDVESVVSGETIVIETKKIGGDTFIVNQHFSNNDPLPLYTNANCWYHCQPFSTICIGCPVAYHANSNIKESVNGNYKFETTDYFEVEGVFCSPECVASYIDERCHLSYYSGSLTLLRTMLLRMGLIKKGDVLKRSSYRYDYTHFGGILIKDNNVSISTINSKRPYMFGVSSLNKVSEVLK